MARGTRASGLLAASARKTRPACEKICAHSTYACDFAIFAYCPAPGSGALGGKQRMGLFSIFSRRLPEHVPSEACDGEGGGPPLRSPYSLQYRPSSPRATSGPRPPSAPPPSSGTSPSGRDQVRRRMGTTPTPATRTTPQATPMGSRASGSSSGVTTGSNRSIPASPTLKSAGAGARAARWRAGPRGSCQIQRRKKVWASANRVGASRPALSG